MPEPHPVSELSPAAEVFAQFLAARDEGGSDDIELVCRDHPLLAERLRRLHADWVGLDRALGGDVRIREGDRYELLECIARGGMGSVHRVYDRHLRRELAMKVLRAERVQASPSSPGDPRAMSRFLDEARITGQLQHPGIPPVHDLGVDGEGRLYFTMPLVPGCTLTRIAERLQQRDPQWPLARVLGILLKACEAVAFAHAQCVIHRDLKPGNIMVGQFGETYVMDWGLARVLGDESDETHSVASARAALGKEQPGSPLVTRDGEIVGTPAYMPPEQARGELSSIGPRSDVYAAGAILYHVLAGTPPYGDERASSTTVLQEVLAGRLVPLTSRVRSVPPEIAAICARAMAPNREDRYADMSGFTADLRAYLEGRVVTAHSVGTLVQLKKLVLRNKPTTVAVVAVIAAVVALVAGLVISLQEAREAEDSNALALTAVETMLAEVGTKRLQDVPRAWPVRRALLTEAIGLYERILERRRADETIEERLARCWRDLGQVQSRLGDLDGAEAALANAKAGFDELAARHPEEERFAVAIADITAKAASIEENRGEVDGAERGLRDALARLAGIGSSTAPVLELRIHVHGQLGALLLDSQRFDEALIEQRHAVALAREACAVDDRPARREVVARRVDQLGLTYSRSKRHQEAEPCHAEAVAILEALHEADAEDELIAGSFACALGNLGLCRKRLEDRSGGEALLSRSVETWRRIVADHPEVPRYDSLLSTGLVDLALTVEGNERALYCLEEALTTIGRAIAMSPESKGYRAQLKFTHRQWLMKLCRGKRHGDVVEGAASLVAIEPLDSTEPLFAAQFVAHAMNHVPGDDGLSGEGRAALLAQYADAVVNHLRTAMDRGCRITSKFEAAHFDAVREHPEYQALLTELRSGSGSGSGSDAMRR